MVFYEVRVRVWHERFILFLFEKAIVSIKSDSEFNAINKRNMWEFYLES